MTNVMDSDSLRKQEEALFHNQREADRMSLSEEEFLAKYPNKRIYAIDRGPKQFLHDWLAERAPGKVALDYCCGLGEQSRMIAGLGATVYGIDISADEIATAERRADEAGLGERTHFQVMDAENMSFDDDTFDIIVCTGVLHHLDLDHAYPELARVLKPGGEIIAVEALGYNPFIQLYRRMTPHLRTAWETDHILTQAQVRQALQHFESAHVTYFHLATLLAIPFIKTPIFKPLLSVLEAVDKVLLKIPGVRLMAWQMIFVLSRPK